MAKAMKSKIKIKMRNVKRKRYYVRELSSLKKMVEEREARRTVGDIVNWNKTAEKLETDDKGVKKPWTFNPAVLAKTAEKLETADKGVKKNWTFNPAVLAKTAEKLEAEDKEVKKICEQMDTCDKPLKIFGKNFKDKDGNYPRWMNSKQKHKLKLKNKKITTRKMKQNKRRKMISL